MLHPQHQILVLHNSDDRSHRLMGWGLVGLFHVFVIRALVSGLAITVIRHMEDPINVRVIPETTKPVATSVPHVTLVRPSSYSKLDPVPPIIKVVEDTPDKGPPPTPGPPTSPTPDSGAVGVLSTHTTPPYPILAIRLGEQGSVQLHVSISATGAVTAAAVTRSSGFPDLDQSAVNWVIAHWKYKPAVQGGVAVASATNAALVFDLKHQQ
jgi:protein TonB